MQKALYILITILFLFINCSQYISIPKKPDGVTIGNKNSQIKLEAYYDLQCPDSKHSNEQLNILFKEKTYLQNLAFTYHYFPLPYHFNSYHLSQTLRFVYDKYGTQAAVEFTNKVFENQQNYDNNKTKTLNLNEIYQKIADDTQSFLKEYSIKSSDVIDALNDQNYNQETRQSWKIGCGNGVSGTPIFYLNGVRIDGAETFDVQNWKKFLEEYLQQKEKHNNFRHDKY
ncbi:hypothetical protein IMG5_183230 [Ichthyophthirius multifiliis]|uniref:Thioredoxin-like fold domain-containing protein n=1 Tax=Ichthyophthirius multifiliis TaxID=5932 RepID=G0R352_ICHMU|nr:hypothetical protein IMG5_183230 [Ichthyophthirius multifiliis]EGR28101.1 hypothetical protein IMG5_183230 [Ichthyophthirius multifiliis]|eukprot:XP_004027446.1 hypothetical protein IMG5_183230 [Ichthyophthirius multifiliis]